jgi:hypothetical protein
MAVGYDLMFLLMTGDRALAMRSAATIFTISPGRKGNIPTAIAFPADMPVTIINQLTPKRKTVPVPSSRARVCSSVELFLSEIRPITKTAGR